MQPGLIMIKHIAGCAEVNLIPHKQCAAADGQADVVLHTFSLQSEEVPRRVSLWRMQAVLASRRFSAAGSSESGERGT